MRKTLLALTTVLFATGSSLAAEPTGEWLVSNGFAHIKVEKCGDRMWGFVSWEKTPGTDSNNPDPSKRTRPMLGTPILLAMKQAGANRWEGNVYNSQDGRTYSASIQLASDDVLRIEGCLLGFLCGGENWTRVKTEGARTRQASMCSKIGEATGSAASRRGGNEGAR